MTRSGQNFAATNQICNFIDFESMDVVDRRKIVQNPNMKDYRSNGRILADLECTDQRYLNSMIQYGLQLWQFLEKILLQSAGKYQRNN